MPACIVFWSMAEQSSAVKVHGNGGIFSLAFPTECFGTGEGLNPIEWESGRKFRHRLGCDTRCTAAAMCSIHVAVSLHFLWDTEDAWKKEIQGDRLSFYIKSTYLSHLFTSVSRYSSAFSSKPGWLDQIALLPHSCNLGHTVGWLLPAHTMMAPKGWSRISQCSTLYKYTRNLTILY